MLLLRFVSYGDMNRASCQVGDHPTLQNQVARETVDNDQSCVIGPLFLKT